MKMQKIILAFEDESPGFSSVLKKIEESYRLLPVKSGQQALRVMYETKPDLIFWNSSLSAANRNEDIGLIMDAIKSDDIPVIFYSLEQNSEYEIKALEMGANDFIGYPVEPDIVLSRIDKVFSVYKTKKNLEYSANKDFLTGLWNRNFLENFIINYHAKENREGIFLLLDLDNFKIVNDTYGHIKGDELLIRFAQMLETEIQSTDLASRIGGDEFVVFLARKMDAAQVKVFLDRLLEVVDHELSEFLNFELQISVSIGITGYPRDGVDFTTLYNKADKALYYIKQNGKQGFHFYKKQNTYAITYDAKDNEVDIKKLRCYIEENHISNGAYNVRYDGFKKIYQFVSRCIERTGQNVQMIIYTLETEEWNRISTEDTNLAIEVLGQYIRNLLRKGDVATKYSNSQYLVILMDATTENGRMVAERIIYSWKNENKNPLLTVSYSMEEIDG